MFKRKENRCSVMESVRDILHVGFMIPDEDLTIACMSRAAMEAGFRSDHFTFESTVVACKLGERVGLPHVTTTIFAAHAVEMNGRASFVEVFIPTEERDLVRRWIRQEVGTHIGLSLVSPLAFGTVHNTFKGEGFRIPPFMHDRPIANCHKGIAVIYYDNFRGGRKTENRGSYVHRRSSSMTSRAMLADNLHLRKRIVRCGYPAREPTQNRALFSALRSACFFLDGNYFLEAYCSRQTFVLSLKRK
jgi:hypothetical protein